MFTNKYPIFKKGNVIDKITLDLLRDNPLEILSLMYLDKKDGIINGFELVTDYERKMETVENEKVLTANNITQIAQKNTTIQSNGDTQINSEGFSVVNGGANVLINGQKRT